MRELRVRSQGADIAAVVSGAETSPPLVVLSSLGADGRMWSDQREMLSRNHLAVFIDSRGHGASEATEGAYSLELLQSDVIAIMDTLGIGSADFLGLSLGGSLALGLALDHPDRVGGLVVCDAQATASEAYRAGWDQRIAAVEKGGMEAVAEGTLARWFTPECPPTVVERGRQMLLETTVHGYVGCANALKDLDYLDRLGEILVPVFYIRGAMDEAAPFSAMEEMARRSPASTLWEIPGAAHVPNMENPKGFAEAWGHWLARSGDRLGEEIGR